MMFKSIYAVDLKLRLAANEPLVLLDVRQPFEHEIQHIPNSILIPLNELPERINELEPYKSMTVVVYCKAGIRSEIACQILARHGYTKLINLADGMWGW